MYLMTEYKTNCLSQLKNVFWTISLQSRENIKKNDKVEIGADKYSRQKDSRDSR